MVQNVLGMHKALGLVLSNATPAITTTFTKEFGIVCPTANGDPVFLHILVYQRICATVWNEHIRSSIAMITLGTPKTPSGEVKPPGRVACVDTYPTNPSNI